MSSSAPTPAIQALLQGQTVTLLDERKTLAEATGELILLPVAACLVLGLPAWGLATLLGPVVAGWLTVPIAAWLMWHLGHDAWTSVGSCKVLLDPHRRVLVRQRRDRHDAVLDDECIPFDDLLLLRVGRADSECASPAFSLRVQVSKNVRSPDVAGYLLYEELSDSGQAALKLAEQSTAALAEQVVAATGMDYLDVQRSTDEGLAPWRLRLPPDTD